LLPELPPPPTVTVYPVAESDWLVCASNPPAPPAAKNPPPPPAITSVSAVKATVGVNVPDEVKVWYQYPPDTVIVPPVALGVPV
jgi:hypothetical protein